MQARACIGGHIWDIPDVGVTLRCMRNAEVGRSGVPTGGIWVPWREREDTALRQIGYPCEKHRPGSRIPGIQRDAGFGPFPAPSGHHTAYGHHDLHDRRHCGGLLGLWILLFLLDANRGNVFVEFVRGTAGWLSWWSQDIFTMDTEWLRVVLNYGLPAVIYLLIGHGIAARLNRA